MCPESSFWMASFRLAINQKKDNDVTICQDDVIVKFFDVTVFFLSSLITGLSFMSIS